RAPRRRRPGDRAGLEAGAVGEDALWLAALRDDDVPEAWERGVTDASGAGLVTDLAALSERVAALEDCLVWEVASGQTIRRELAELQARLDELDRAPAAAVAGAVAGAATVGGTDEPPHPEPADSGEEARQARREVVEGLRASVRAAGRLLDGRRPGTR
ncbi:MAG: hypothetical protein ACRDY5_08945, partial [Acidimicrobiales bacterium]